MRRPSASRVASMFAAHPCKQGGPCQCGGGCGQQPLMMQPDYGAKEGDGESYMSVQALQSMRDHADDLLDRLDHNTPLPDWVEAKLTRAAQSLNDVYEYMSHGKGQRKYASEPLMERYYHVEYPNYRTIRLLVYHPRWSSFLETRANAGAAEDLVQKLAEVGFSVTEEQMEEAIEQA